MTIRQRLAISTSTLFLLTLPCQAGPCSADIERIQANVSAKLHALAALGPNTSQSTDAQLHRQPTPRSMAETEMKLGELPPGTVETVKDAMDRARKADIANGKSACEQALADVQRVIGP
jgi:hypothetical protein